MSETSRQPDLDMLGAVLAQIAAPAVIVDGAGVLRAANPASTPRLAGGAAAAIGQSAADVVAGLASAVRLPLAGRAADSELLVWPASAYSDDQAIELQKADMLGRLAGGISHTLANPLGAIVTYASVIATDPGVPADLVANAALLHDEADRTLRLVRGTLEFARRRPPKKERVALGQLVRECLDLVASATASLNKRVAVSEVMPELDLHVAGLRQAILALLVTAVESMGGTWASSGAQASGSLRIAGYLAEEDGRYRARLTFDDTGPVVPAASRQTLFDGSGERATRDLAAAAALAERAGGLLTYEALADGNRMILDLPLPGYPPLQRPAPIPQPQVASGRPAVSAGGTRASDGETVPAASVAGDAAVASRTSTATRAQPGKGGLSVLVCDDEPSIRTLLVRVITRGAHRAREASGGAEALAVLDSEPVDLVIADQRMADMTGVDLYRAAVDRRPELATRFVLMSGDAGTPELVEFAAATGLQVIEKPFDLKVVSATLERIAQRG